MDLIIGSHTHFKKDTQLLSVVEQTLNNKANAMMFYTGPNASSVRYSFDEELTNKGLELMKENNIDSSSIIVHAPFILNFANDSDDRKYNFYINFLKEEINRCEKLGVKKLVVHPGSHVGIEKSIALRNVSEAMNIVLKDVDYDITILLEYMSGKGTEVGSSIDELATIINGIKYKDKIGVCIDTCHMNDSGIDISKFDLFLDEFDLKIGIDKIKCIHLNDSLNIVGAKKDRHANIGYGTIGFDNLINVAYNERLVSVPKILETPEVNSSFKREIDCIKNKKFIEYITL